MKKILILLFSLLVFSFTFSKSETIETSDKKLDYIIEIIKSDENDYTAKIKLEQSVTDDGTLGLIFIRICHTFKRLQEKYPNASWYFVETIKPDGKEYWTASMKNKDVKLQDKEEILGLAKEVVKHWNIAMHPEDRERINNFIENKNIPTF